MTGINVGAQPYWNAEATMLMHTRGILVMTPESAMVLTGKQALDFAGGVSAEDNFGIGGYDRIMGPNGQAQYWAPRPPGACRTLLAHYEHTYVAPGERFPRRADTADPIDRDVRTAPHAAPASALHRVGDVFSDEANPGRKLPFDIRSVMRAVTDADHIPLERWAAMRDAEAAVVWHAHLGGWPVSLLGIESHPLPRAGVLPADGPEQWTSGTLFPRSAKKIARAINAASGRVPVVVLANLAGFDGSPESMRELQLEFGAEIGRAVVNFRGPIVFCVISRYHGGAFVVFSQRLNEQLEAVAVDGARASVIGGSAAAAVVFAREVDAAARADERDPRARRADRGRRGDRPGRAAVRARRALDRRARREDGRVRGPLRRRAQRRAGGPHGLGQLDRRPRRAAPLPDRGGRARHGAHAGAGVVRRWPPAGSPDRSLTSLRATLGSASASAACSPASAFPSGGRTGASGAGRRRPRSAARDPAVEVLAAADGAPEAWRGDERLPVSLSLSHREGLALVAVTEAPAVVGCDLERLEPRSAAFVATGWRRPSRRSSRATPIAPPQPGVDGQGSGGEGAPRRAAARRPHGGHAPRDRDAARRMAAARRGVGGRRHRHARVVARAGRLRDDGGARSGRAAAVRAHMSRSNSAR